MNKNTPIFNKGGKGPVHVPPNLPTMLSYVELGKKTSLPRNLQYLVDPPTITITPPTP